MNNSLKNDILKALTCAISPDKNLNDQAENYLLVDNLNNIEFFKLLLTISIDDTVEDKLRVSSLIILKKILITNWRKLNQPTQELISNSFLNLILNSKSIRCLNLMSEILYKIILYRNNSSDGDEEDEIKEKWPEFEINLLEAVKNNINNFDNLYRCLIAYHMLAKTREHSSSKERPIITKSVMNFFPILESLIVGLTKAELNQQNIEFMKIICKIFFKCYRYGVDSYIANPEKINLWMDFFLGILTSNNLELYKPKKWVLRIFLPFLRNFCDTKSEKEFREFGDFWRNSYFKKILMIFINILKTYDRSMKQEKVIFNLSRNFYHIIKLDDYFNEYKNEIFDLFKNNLIKLIRFTEDDYDVYVNDPVEYFKKNDEFCFDHTIRDSIMNIIASLARGDLLNNMVLFFAQELAKENEIIPREGIYFIIHKLADKLRKCDNGNFAENLINNFVLKDLNSKEGFMRTRCCILISRFSQSIFNENILKTVVSQICQKLKDPDFPVRSYAAITLDRLLLNPAVVDIVRPEIQTVLVIYVNLIQECDNESLINSLTGIFETFNKELAPYAKELLRKMVNLIIGLYEKTELKTNEQIEENEFSIISAFQSMHELMKAPFEESDIEEIYIILEKLFLKIIKENDTELLEELLKLFNLLVFRSKKGALLPQLWNYFEFFCYILNTNQIPDSNYQFRNFLLQYASPNRGSYAEMQGTIITIFKNFFYKEPDTLIKKTDEFGKTYISLLFQTLESLKLVESGYDDECNKAQTLIFEANLTTELLENPLFTESDLLIKQKTEEMIKYYIKYSERIMTQKKKEIIETNIIYHNFGVYFWKRFGDIFNLLKNTNQNLCNNLILNWTKEHKEILTYRVRKGSFLGLLELVRNIDNIDFLKNEKEPLLQFLLKDLIFQDIQHNIELENSQCDFALDDFEDVEVQEDLVLDSLENIKSFFKQNDNNYPLETEILLNADFDFCIENFSKTKPVELFKNYMGEVGIDLNTLNSLLANFSNELKGKIFEILGIKMQN